MKRLLQISNQISNNEKWQALVSCDASYDGLFFYGVKTTRIFCRPSCRAKTPVRENVVFFDHAIKAMEEGFRPCKKCCPDQITFQPDLDLVKKAKGIFNANYNKQIDLKYISKQLGISRNHLTRLFKYHTSLTISQYITKLRITKGVELMEKTEVKILDIAYMTGFNSLSNFYKCFKEQTGYTPNHYRKGRGER
ncbi:MAG: AraC family transcriptional regulator [Desulfitibacter sp. BRH_c19]|nr:MAG: AraC family transcriptional regulator [Desulfitibacter sp. BRH_c19]